MCYALCLDLATGVKGFIQCFQPCHVADRGTCMTLKNVIVQMEYHIILWITDFPVSFIFERVISREVIIKAISTQIS